MGIIREKKHRLPPEAYRGRVIAAFTINTANQQCFFDDERIYQIAIAALALQRAMQRSSAAARYWVLLAALGAMLAAPVAICQQHVPGLQLLHQRFLCGQSCK